MQAALHEGALTWPALLVALPLAGMLHMVEVGRNTYGVVLVTRLLDRRWQHRAAPR